MDTPPISPHGPPGPDRPSPEGLAGTPFDAAGLRLSEPSAARVAKLARMADIQGQTPEQAVESARSDGRTRQGSLLVMVPVRAGMEPSLRALLDLIADPPGGDLEINPEIPFLELKTVHFARILVHDASPSPAAPVPAWRGRPQAHGPAIPAKLLFSTDFDGPLDAHLDELVRVAGAGLDRLFSHCEEWPPREDQSPAAVKEFILRYRVASNTFYTGTMGRSVDQIRREARLHERIEDYLDRAKREGTLPADPVAAREQVRGWVFAQPDLEWARGRPGPFPKPLVPARLQSRLGLIAGAAALGVLAALYGVLQLFLPAGAAFGIVAGLVVALGAAAFAAWRFLRRLEAADPVIVGDVTDHTRRLERYEDHIVQNQMSSVIYIKEPLRFRRSVLWAVLAFIDLSAKYLSNTGTLAGIPSIHFARWVIVDEGRRLLFFSNFDGSWENYLGDFIDKAASGLTGVWSNCVGFPRTAGLVGGGARDEQKFKQYSRQSQVPTQVWYSAYRWLSVPNVNNNSKIRIGLHGDMGAEEAAAWLRRFSGPAERTEPAGEKPVALAPQPAAAPELEDIQGLVARSYRTLRHGEYVLVGFSGTEDARRWLAALVPHVTAARRTGGDPGRAVQVAFTREGLEALGVGPGILETFSLEFQDGMASPYRSRLLGDVGGGDPARWEWGGTAPGSEPVHALLFLFARDAAELEALFAETVGGAAGARALRRLPSIMLEGDKEHFGFHDGIAQPRVQGFRPEDRPAPLEPEIPTGEVVLGYRNVYRQVPESPWVPRDLDPHDLLRDVPPDPDREDPAPRRDLGRNGTYVVFRQLEQDVKRFWQFMDERTRDAAERRKLAARAVGRWPNGAPLVLFPDAEPAGYAPEKQGGGNDFMYVRDHGIPGNGNDPFGDKCPIGAHVRRANPRDGMQPGPNGSLLVADHHRLLRRGRAYGEPLAPSFDPADILAAPDGGGDARGLHFICLNSDLGRQFEFVQNTWINSGKFDGLYSDPDAVIAPHVPVEQARHAEQVSNFTVQQCPVRHREKGLTPFVTMRGGAYFFMPGVSALRWLAGPR